MHTVGGGDFYCKLTYYSLCGYSFFSISITFLTDNIQDLQIYQKFLESQKLKETEMCKYTGQTLK